MARFRGRSRGRRSRGMTGRLRGRRRGGRNRRINSYRAARGGIRL